VNTKHEHFLIVKYGKGKQNMNEMSTNFPKFWKIVQSGTFVILVVVVCGMCSASLFVWVSVGKRAPSVCGRDDGVQMFVR
jgi:hypothetical protein